MRAQQAVFPPGAAPGAVVNLSPAIVSGDHIFLTGMTGSAPDGLMPEYPDIQFRSAFDKIATVLAAACADWVDVEVAGLRRSGALVETRVIARHAPQSVPS